ncbi:class I SAM-dependent methyltransferase [Egicoccus sp. AB-alg6-2]|uniref:class I SAM-dependent methyltransferase n=1 Tax=Egicoccus sp. AB-alg6-2 TaxID=3242692 RepID=UPI00359DF016
MTSSGTSTDVQQAMDTYWHRRAPHYHDHQRRTQTAAIRDFWTRLWQDALPAAPIEVLDVGTGTGEVAAVLARLGHRVTAIDTAAGMLELARQRPLDSTGGGSVVWQHGDAVRPPFPPASFDAVTSRYVLWTLRDPVAALERWRALLRPGGRLVAVDSTWFPEGIHPTGPAGDASRLPEFQRHYTRAVTARLPLAEADSITPAVRAVEAAGFEDVTLEPLEPLERLQTQAAIPSDHDIRLQYLITATAPR